jgi:predicted ArsR family transcriptional regulator
MELLVDPVRAQIYFEVLLQGEVTAQEMMKRLSIVRSTLTHHLTKFVKAEVFSVRVESTGRPVKHYRLNTDFEEAVVIDDKDETTTTFKKRVTFLESTAAHMQMIANLTRTLARKMSETPKLEGSSIEPVCFVFSLLSEEEVTIWNRHHSKFLADVESEIKEKVRKKKSSAFPTHVAFSGTIPLTRDRN